VDLNLFDVLAIVVLVTAILAGIRTGALPQVGGIVGALTGVVVGLNAAPLLVSSTHDLEPVPRALVVLGGILGLVAIGEMLGSALGRAAAGGLRPGVLSGVDRFAGALLGATQAVLIVWLLGGLLAAGPFPGISRAATHSTAVRVLDDVLPPPTDVVGEIANALDDSGLPDVFVGLEPIPAPPVDKPTDPEAEAIARTAEASTARISTRACDALVSGTGALIAPGYLVTNAHVVAGARTVRATIGGDVADATVVLFDPDLDVAVLHVPDLKGTPLRFASVDPDRGVTGAALGYAGGGSLTVLPAAVSNAYAATGRDIYDKGRITRDILELRAEVEPGDSGGPLILPDGTIGGVVFAESRVDPEVGYALSPTSVAVEVAPAIVRTRAVDVGPCLR
jgi:S1-C subfamily serine protease